AAPPSSVMNSRRLMAPSQAEDHTLKSNRVGRSATSIHVRNPQYRRSMQWICSCGVMPGSKPPQAIGSVRGISKARDWPLLRDNDLLHPWLPQLLLLADEFGRLSWRHRLREGSEVRKLLPKFGVIEDGPQVLSHLAHYPIGCPGRREQREPTRCHESRNCFSYGRQIRKIRQPPRRGNRDRLERAPLNGAQQRSQALHNHRDASAHQVLQSGRGTGIRNEPKLDARLVSETFGREVRQRAACVGGVQDLARSFLRKRDQILE